jgi:protein-disulfide isomerase
MKFDLTVPLSPVDHVLGHPGARVAVVEYGDFECPNCKQAAPAVKLLLKRFAGRIQVGFRHFPLEEVHPHALHAAMAAEAAAAQGKFWPMHDLLFENQARLKLHYLHSYAERLELDLVRFDAEMLEGLYLQRIREGVEEGRRSGVRGTPTFFVNGKLRDVSFGIQELARAVEAA